MSLLPVVAPVTAHAVRLALQERYKAGEYLFFTEAGDDGSSSGSRADAIAISTWASRAYVIHGFEIKISRSDWQRELARPSKNAGFMRRCDFWWLVAPENVARAGELPINWGQMAFADGRLRVVVKAPQLKPEPFDRAFGVSLLKQAGEFDRDKLREELEAREKNGRQDYRESCKQEVANAEAQTAAAQSRLKVLRDELGAAHQSDGEIIRAIRAVIKSGAAAEYGGLTYLEKQLREAADQIAGALKEAMPKSEAA